jgi:hypothetical protein
LLSVSPGRFFAVDEVKALFAHIVATYDIKFEEGVPPEFFIARSPIPPEYECDVQVTTELKLLCQWDLKDKLVFSAPILVFSVCSNSASV